MATTYLDPQMLAPSAASLDTLYTVTSGKALVVGAIVCCNTDSTSTTITVALIPSGDSLGTKNYIVKNLPLCGNDTYKCPDGLTLAASGVVKVSSASGGVAFTLTGAEIN